MTKCINELLRVLRRRFLLTFNREYIVQSLEKRKGKCNNCGCCCLIAKPNCLNRIVEGGCKIYGGKRWQLICNTPEYPIDEMDKIEGTEDYCGFYWCL